MKEKISEKMALIIEKFENLEKREYTLLEEITLKKGAYCKFRMFQ